MELQQENVIEAVSSSGASGSTRPRERPSTTSIRSPATSSPACRPGRARTPRAPSRPPRGVRRVAADAARCAPGDLSQGRRRARGSPGRGRLAAGARDRLHVRLRDVPDPLRPRAPPPSRRTGVRTARGGDPVRHRRVRDGGPPAGRRRRRDRAVERGADPVRPVDRGAARAREHRRAEAVRAPPVVGGLLWGEIFTEAGLPPGVLNIVTTHRARPGRSATSRREPARPPAQLHRLDRDRAQARRGRGPEAEADRARARRLQPADRARGRGPRVRGQRDDVRRVPAPGPDLHVRAEDHRRAAIADAFVERLAAKTKRLKAGDPKEPTRSSGR